MDKRAPGVLREKKHKKKPKKKKKKTATTTLKASSTRDTLETRHRDDKRCQVANSQCTRIGTLCIANRASRKTVL